LKGEERFAHVLKKQRAKRHHNFQFPNFQFSIPFHLTAALKEHAAAIARFRAHALPI
jgi:hypothetical protein